jgi:hypothetical protein
MNGVLFYKIVDNKENGNLVHKCATYIQYCNLFNRHNYNYRI